MQEKQYYTMLTKIGIAKFIAARASGNGINLKRFKLSSQSILPNENITTLEGIVYEANINSKYVDEENDCYVNLECVVPSNVGGFEINAIGIYDEENHLIALGNLPPTYKPRLEQGSAKELLIKVVMELKNASEVVLELNPSVVLASRDFVNKIKLELNLRIDAEVERFTQELKKYALKNGDSTQNFQVADAKNPNEAVNKKQLDAVQKKAQELDAALEQKMQTTIKQTIETSTIAGATLTKRVKTGNISEPVKTIGFYVDNRHNMHSGSYLAAQIAVNGVVIYSKSVSVSCNNNGG
ncbi:phage tail protein [uncultured Helicobacter sp.]|uniref:phage tail protein n=1 Tax=uncultured Helicobacter sp. TaxID=175537 RepID=UPI0026254719|nr:phage tail protein [uncultured Helicobacter sp.]